MYRCKKYLLPVIGGLLFCACVSAQAGDEVAVRSLLNAQVSAWNKGNLTEFMDTYWRSDSLKFIGKSGITYGWDKTLNNYLKRYPDTIAMGKLNFTVVEVKQLSPEFIFVIGKWALVRTIGNLEGHYTLLIRKISGQWKIIDDHSS